MHFLGTILTSVLAFATFAVADDINIWGQDGGTHIVTFLPSSGHVSIPPITIGGPNSKNPLDMPQGWNGTFFAVLKGEDPMASYAKGVVVGRLCFHCDGGATQYAVDDSNGNNNNWGIHQIIPVVTKGYYQVTGCFWWPCTGKYCTKSNQDCVASTPSTSLIVKIGKPDGSVPPRRLH